MAGGPRDSEEEDSLGHRDQRGADLHGRDEADGCRLDIHSLCVQILAAALVTASFLMSPVIEDMYGESVTVKLGLVFSSEKHIETFPFVELFV